MKINLFPIIIPFLVLFIPAVAFTQSITDIDNSIKNEENMLKKLQKDKKSTVKQLESISNQIDNYRKLMRTLNKEITANGKKIETLRANIGELSKNIDKTKKDITKSNRFFIDNLGFSELTVVATAKKPAETIKTLEILSLAGTGLEKNVREQSRKVFEMNRLVNEERARMEEAEELNKKRRNAVVKLETENKKYQNTLVLIKNDEAGRKEYVEMLRFQRQTLDDELKRATSLVIKKDKGAANPKSEFVHSTVPKGSMVWPVNGNVIEPYGETFMADAGVTFFHKGIKIRPEKTGPVFASAAGNVIFADYIRGFDNIMVVDHGDGFYTVYGNLNDMKAEIGEKIERGDILGRINVDLNNNTSYLYFEIRKNDEALNPADWLAGYNTKVNQ